MSKVVSEMSMSLDGFIAGPDDGVEHLFGWFQTGPVEVPSADPRWSYHASPASAEVLRGAFAGTGAMICGRRLFDHTQGWGGNHPLGVPVFVVTHQVPADWAHPEAPFTFVTDGVASAVEQARAAAGDRNVAVASPTIIQQCLDLGLLDEVNVSLVPVLLGAGIRYFDRLAATPVHLDDPEVVEGTGVTHLKYRVRKH
jgi:dihydrofolate reductase